jgi:hypothetical protein
MISHTEDRIWLLYAKALAAKTPEDTKHAVQELRAELGEQRFASKRLLEAQIINFEFLDAATRDVSSTDVAAACKS